MKDTKDLFSSKSGDYRKFRPEYPLEFVEEIVSLSPGLESAWDCATGNGQVATILADHFKSVCATDISSSQLENAVRHSHIQYEMSRAESTGFTKNSFDLITVAQAVHWFDFKAFYKEVRRVARKNGILAIWGYGLLRFNNEIDQQIDHFYRNTVGIYWDKERQFIEQSYKNIPFPFPEIQLSQEYTIKKDFSRESLAGYLGTWSSVKKFTETRGFNPIKGLLEDLIPYWGDPEKQLTAEFPLFTRIGRI